jgi:hypothetical protein
MNHGWDVALATMGMFVSTIAVARREFCFEWDPL